MKLYPGLEVIDTPFEGGRHINVCLFGEDRPVLVDTGVAGSPTAVILPALDAVGVGAADLRMVVNLHAHADHIGGNGEVFAASGELVTFAAHVMDAAAIEDHHLLALQVYGLADTERIRALLARCGAHVPIRRLFRGGEVVPVNGQSLQIVHAPGHTVGNLALYEASHRVLLHGESVMGAPVANAEGLLSTPFGHNPVIYRRTLERLAGLDFEVYIPSHQPVTGRAEGLAEIAASRAGLDAWEAACRVALAQGAEDTATLAAAVAAEGRYATGPRLDGQVAAWVEAEVRAGRAVRGTDGALRAAS